LKFLPLISGLALCLLLAACAGSKSPPVTALETKQAIEEQKQDAVSETTQRQVQNLQTLIKSVSQTNGIPIEFLENGFRDRQHLSQVKKLIAPPPVTFQKNWQVYRSRFVEPVRIKAGLAFIEQNRTALEAAEDLTGVPYQVIAAIIGVETIYGRQMGNFRVKDVLSTLAFDYPEVPNKVTREILFRDQLKDLIILCWQEAKLKQEVFNRCLNQSSSYAGAVGLPQFMPGSILQFAKDGDGDGIIDLRNSRRDAIFSVANFLKVHGWQPGMPIYFPTINTQQTYPKLVELADGQPVLKYTVEELIQFGILEPNQGDLLKGGVEPISKALIVDLPSPGKNQEPEVEYVVGLQNFLSIVNYNRSYFYAQSVAEFAQALGYKNQSAIQAVDDISKNTSNNSQSKKKVNKQKKSRKASKPTD
jgi:membrane-bound lytic murein transglycosylase B